jgi:hypothetical protein
MIGDLKRKYLKQLKYKLRTPYLSIIVASRNDNHGDNMSKRMRLFIKGMIEQTNRFALNIELIIVEWNPPNKDRRLFEILPRPTNGDYLTLKYILVPYKLHKQFRFSEKLPLYQMIAKNVGIRRGECRFYFVYQC